MFSLMDFGTYSLTNSANAAVSFSVRSFDLEPGAPWFSAATGYHCSVTGRQYLPDCNAMRYQKL